MTTQKPECSLAKAAESVRIALKPVGFFNYNPTMDVPPSNQTFNQSKLYDPTLQVGADSQVSELPAQVNRLHINDNGHAAANGVNGVNGVNGTNGSCCSARS
jgi:hypothetical protein